MLWWCVTNGQAPRLDGSLAILCTPLHKDIIQHQDTAAWTKLQPFSRWLFQIVYCHNQDKTHYFTPKLRQMVNNCLNNSNMVFTWVGTTYALWKSRNFCLIEHQKLGLKVTVTTTSGQFTLVKKYQTFLDSSNTHLHLDVDVVLVFFVQHHSFPNYAKREIPVASFRPYSLRWRHWPQGWENLTSRNTVSPLTNAARSELAASWPISKSIKKSTFSDLYLMSLLYKSKHGIEAVSVLLGQPDVVMIGIESLQVFLQGCMVGLDNID